MKIFLDEVAWIQISDAKASHHRRFQEELRRALDTGDRLFTTNIAVGLALSHIKRECGMQIATRFNETIENAYTGTHLGIIWIGRRTQKEAVRLLRKYPDLDLGIYDFAAYQLMKRRRVNTILTNKIAFRQLGLQVIPEIGETG